MLSRLGSNASYVSQITNRSNNIEIDEMERLCIGTTCMNIDAR